MTARRDWRQGAAGLVVASFGFPNCACLASANLKRSEETDDGLSANTLPITLQPKKHL